MRSFELPEKAKRFLVPGVLVFAALLIAGGFYFRQRSLNLVPQIVVPEEEGEVSGAHTSLPENFPQDIPLFEPSEILSSMESQERIQITLQTEASAERVRRFYERELPDDRRTELTITTDPEGLTTVVLTITP